MGALGSALFAPLFVSSGAFPFFLQQRVVFSIKHRTHLPIGMWHLQPKQHNTMTVTITNTIVRYAIIKAIDIFSAPYYKGGPT